MIIDAIRFAGSLGLNYRGGGVRTSSARKLDSPEVPTVCRLSIIVPYSRDEAAFEASLVSVLENRPEFCEVIVSHDGQYMDPFDLGDEVRFVIAPAADTITLIRTAVAAAMGRVVHVMMGGVRATENWSDEPVSLFEQADLACVAPIIRDLSAGGGIIAAGWKDAGSRLQQPIAGGQKNPGRRDAAAIQGAYLAASFWRRNTLESFLELPLEEHTKAYDYVLATTLKQAGWRCRLATSSDVLASPQSLTPSTGTAGNWAAIQEFRSGIGRERGISAAVAALFGALTSPFQASAWSEMLGRCSAAFSDCSSVRPLVDQMIEVSAKVNPNAANEQILQLPQRASAGNYSRRAA